MQGGRVAECLNCRATGWDKVDGKVCERCGGTGVLTRANKPAVWRPRRAMDVQRHERYIEINVLPRRVQIAAMSNKIKY